ncbi:MAG: hypothetical protein US50_C0017G0014 [Candidatus Nomurabacteria bacterium GW2011_GWB1_37_5]|uniref:Uncharacterized protein n=1 Tax=Candidatus Nomurabacteria bacterium GW2011_GWB1_37_5 TaxID=1618742 RepID=A0A0G0GWH1_9BACT|nr:MAG: hypothetical protein US50_C0017G0014 [Candidatus Nomurabacteria bacterium GW2011_GWB1_37_5]
MKQSPEEYCALLSTTAKTTYNDIGSVYCSILKKEVIFNAKGFHHLHYKPNGTPRDVSEKIYKLTLIPLAAPVIKNALGIHEERDVEIPESRKKGAKRMKGKQYALVAKVGRKNPIEVRVIILEIENSNNPIFWSIMKH